MITKPVHFIQYEMVINPLYKKNVHHLLAYECDDDYVLATPLAQECGRKGLPSSVGSKCMQKMVCKFYIVLHNSNFSVFNLIIVCGMGHR